MYTDEDIRSAPKVTVHMAAKYLGWPPEVLYDGLRNGDPELDFGFAQRLKSGRWRYPILPEPLIRFKHRGIARKEAVI